MKQIFIRFEAKNETGFILLYCIEANQRILHAKRIRIAANIPFQAKFEIFVYEFVRVF